MTDERYEEWLATLEIVNDEAFSPDERATLAYKRAKHHAERAKRKTA